MSEPGDHDRSVEPITLEDLARCFQGAVPGVMSTASADGVPNVIYVSRAHRVDDERIALSNQFLSKTARNIAVNPRASLLLLDPGSYDQFRLQLTYERTERRGQVFDQLRADVEALAELEGMQDVFRLRAADIYRVASIERVPAGPLGTLAHRGRANDPGAAVAALAEVTARMARCGTLDDLLDAMLEGLDELFGYRHAYVLLADADGRRLSTFASRGYADEVIGAELEVGAGLVGTAAARCRPVRVGGLRQATKYSRAVRSGYEAAGEAPRGASVPLPGRPDSESLLAVPAQARGELIGVLVVESPDQAAYEDNDEATLAVVAAMLAQAVEHFGALDASEPTDDAAPAATRPLPEAPRPTGPTTTSASTTWTAAPSSTAST